METGVYRAGMFRDEHLPGEFYQIFKIQSNATPKCIVFIRGGHQQNFPDRLIGWAQAIIAAFHLINGGPPP